MGFRDDAAGVKGMFVDPDVLKTAVVAAISATLARLAPSVLPLRELVRGAALTLPYCALAHVQAPAGQARWSSGRLVEAARCLHRAGPDGEPLWWHALTCACTLTSKPCMLYWKGYIHPGHQCTLT